MRFLGLICVIAPLATAQVHPHFGVDVGVPLTDTLLSSSFASLLPNGSLDRYNSDTKRFFVGPVFRLELPSGLGLEIDALYQRVDYDLLTQSFTTVQPVAPSPFVPPPTILASQRFEQTTGNRWQFPLLVQYGWARWKVRPFVEAGPSISKIANSRSTVTTTSPATNVGGGNSTYSSSTSTTTGQGGTQAGITAGGGVDVPLFHGHLRPEFRYSHWFSPMQTPQSAIFGGIISVGGVGFSTFLSPLSPDFRTNRNEASFVLGLTF